MMSAYPSGTVTFVFTDIEASTRIAQEYPEQWESLRDHHHAILRAAVETYRGYVFQIIGDAFCVAFHTAGEAIRAAVKSQTDLQAEAGGGSLIKVRVGIHTGQAEIQADGQYRGYLAMSRVQRLMSAGHGGQVLLSLVTEELVRNELPDGISLRDMGERRLKDLVGTEHVFQLVIPGLPADFPSLKTADVPRHNLPTPITSFIGRQAQVAEVKHWLATTRLVTLTGSGGCGKSRLAIEVASQLQANFPDDIWLIELAPLAEPAQVLQAIAVTLGLREGAERPVQEVITDYLRAKTTLLVLDNCEHLIAACAQVSQDLLQACAKLRILATSREALGVVGEVVYQVPSLSIPRVMHPETLAEASQFESVRLFAERAASVSARFVLGEQTISAVTQICNRLDGIPLAIELAAARVKVLSVEQIAQRLDDRFHFLTGGSRTALPRQQTLRATIDWSYRLLSDAERRLFCRLAVFVGGWTLEAAEAVCVGGGLKPPTFLTRLRSS